MPYVYNFDSWDDELGKWSTEANAYDDNVVTNATCLLTGVENSGYLTLNFASPVFSSGVQIYFLTTSIDYSFNMQVQNTDDSWTSIFTGTLAQLIFVPKPYTPRLIKAVKIACAQSSGRASLFAVGEYQVWAIAKRSKINGSLISKPALIGGLV